MHIRPQLRTHLWSIHLTDYTDGNAILESLGVEPIINAGGPVTRFSGTRPRPEAVHAMVAMAGPFVELNELMIAAGKRIADLIGVPAATITSGASGGLVLQTAAAMARDNDDIIDRLPIVDDGVPTELIIQKNHRFGYDHLYLTPGARFVEVGDADGCTPEEVADAVNENTAAIIHLESPYSGTNVLPIETLVDIAHDSGLPLLCDAASRLPPRANLTKFVEAGADLVSFSGGKGIRGPQATGILVGNEEWVEYARLSNAPRATVARAQKVSKEAIAGLVAAIEAFIETDEDEENRRYTRMMQKVVDQVIEIPGIDAEVVHDYDHYIPHAVLKFNDQWRGPSKEEIGDRMLEGPDRVMILSYFQLTDEFWVDPLNLEDDELDIVADKLRRTLIDASAG